MTKYFLLNFLINTFDKASQNENTFFFPTSCDAEADNCLFLAEFSRFLFQRKLVWNINRLISRQLKQMPRNHVLHQWRSTSNSLQDDQTVLWKNVEIRRVSWATTNQLSHESHVTSSKTSLQETGYVSCWKKVFFPPPFANCYYTNSGSGRCVYIMYLR